MDINRGMLRTVREEITKTSIDSTAIELLVWVFHLHVGNFLRPWHIHNQLPLFICREDRSICRLNSFRVSIFSNPAIEEEPKDD